MFFAIFIAFISLVGLLILHEFGHFILAKRFGVKVEEFGIGYPPRIFGKKIGETIYSLNLLPFGAFVRISGEERDVKGSGTFFQQPIWKRILIVFGGVLSFWVIGAVVFSLVFGIGVPTAISDETDVTALKARDVKVVVLDVRKNSPADVAGLKVADAIEKVKSKETQESKSVDKVKEVQEFINLYKGKEVVLTIQRGREFFDVSLIPRISFPQGEGPLGIALVRAAILPYPWYKSPFKGITACFNTAAEIIKGLSLAFLNVVRGLPSGVQLIGPVGIGELIYQHFNLGINYFLQLIAVISIYLAIFNLLPIPAVDGGKLLFLIIEKIKGRPIKREIEQKINAVFFTLLLGAMFWVTIKDITRLL